MSKGKWIKINNALLNIEKITFFVIEKSQLEWKVIAHNNSGFPIFTLNYNLDEKAARKTMSELEKLIIN